MHIVGQCLVPYSAEGFFYIWEDFDICVHTPKSIVLCRELVTKLDLFMYRMGALTGTKSLEPRDKIFTENAKTYP